MYLTIRLAFLAIKGSPFRSVLRVIALFILMASFMTSISIGAGIRHGLSEAQALKDNEINLTPGNTGGNTQNIDEADRKEAYLTVREARQLLDSRYVTNYNFYLWTTAYMQTMPATIKSGGSEAEEIKKTEPEGYLLWVCGCTRLDLQSDFRKGGLKLISGRPFSEGGAEEVVISSELAKKNNLAVGSVLLLEDSKSKTKEKVVVGGVFGKGDTEGTGILYDLYTNMIFAPLETVRRLSSAAESGQPEGILTSASFFLDDPGHYEAFAEEAKSGGMDMKSFRLEPDNTEYTRATRPLRELDTAMKALISVLAAVGVLSMLLSGIVSMKRLKTETSLLRIIGFGKKRVMLRFAAEIAVICFTAYGAAAFTGAAAAPFAADRLMKLQVEAVSSAETERESIFIIGDEYKVSQKPDAVNLIKAEFNETDGGYVDKIHPSVGKNTAVFFISMGLLLILCRLGPVAYAVSRPVKVKTGLEGGPD